MSASRDSKERRIELLREGQNCLAGELLNRVGATLPELAKGGLLRLLDGNLASIGRSGCEPGTQRNELLQRNFDHVLFDVRVDRMPSRENLTVISVRVIAWTSSFPPQRARLPAPYHALFPPPFLESAKL